MASKGIVGGLRDASWRRYEPRLVATVASGTGFPTEPSLGSDGLAEGRYLELDGGLIVAQVRILFGTTANGMSAGGSPNPSHAWMLKLPKPANRWTASLNGGNADLPIGTGLLRQDITADPMLTMPMIPTLADPFVPHAYQSGQDDYAQMFCAHSIEVGSDTITGSDTFVECAHSLGITPAASDINVVISGITGAPSAPRNVYVTDMDADSFRINVQIAPGGTDTITFAWKIRAEPNTSQLVTPLVNHARPWAWTENSQIQAQLIYESKFG